MNKKLKKKFSFIKLNWSLYLMILPGIAWFIVFCYVPYYGYTLAFKDYHIMEGIWGSPWSGLKNFRELFSDPYFIKVMVNTVRISVITLIFSFPVPILLAIGMNEMTSAKFKKIEQTIVYLPYFISWVIVAGMLNAIFSKTGVLNEFLMSAFGIEIPFYSNSIWFVVLLVISNIWKNCGWGTVIYFASLTNISPELYEVAALDGAKRFQKIWYITLPGLSPAITITLILSLGGLFSGNFDQIVNMYNQLVYDKADVIDTYIYRIGLFDGKYGLSTALSLFSAIICFLLILSTNFLSKLITKEGIW